LVRRLPFDLRPDEALFRMRVVATELATAGPPDSLVVHAARLVQDPRARSIDLVRALGVSERQLRRRFDAAVGYGPKTLQRVLRFQRFLAGMSRREDGVDLAQLAAAAGYADQAHLTREAGLLSGRSPAVLARDRTGVLAAAAGARIEFGQGSPWSAEHLRGGQPT
jgi:methylphosphotriester-DNA--protein-cysteine methyltransferase